MNFASSHVYDDAGEPESYEVVSDEEFLGGMELSDSDGSGEDAVEEDSIQLSAPLGCALATGATEMDAAREHKSKPSMLGRVMGFLSGGGGGGGAPPPNAPRPPRPPRHRKVSRLHHWKSSNSSDGSATNRGEQIYEDMASGENKNSKRRMFRRADTNVVSLRFDTLKTPSAMHAGEVIRCRFCEAIMSHISQIKEDGPDKVWTCEFCERGNVVEIEEEERPGAADVTFLLEPALSTAAAGASGRDQSIVIFCIDISGSMTITTEVPGHQRLRGSDSLRRLRRDNSMEGDQRLPSERRNVTYISRLQAVQAAVDHQLGEMAREHPHRRVGLVTFSYEVNVVGDGTGEEVVVSGQKLMDQAELSKVGADLPCPKPIKETRAFLGEKIFGLEEGGSTALGPALVIALSMASQHPGSKVIVCTDGKSNEGVGKVENIAESDPDPDQFYDGMAKTANEKGVSFSVVTIKGTDCKLIQLGKLADSTGGQVNIVDPLKLTEEFSNVLADRIIATSVVALFILHRGLYIGKEENAASSEKREVGNVSADHEISFEYGVRKKTDQKKPSPQAPSPNPLDGIREVSTSMEASSPAPKEDQASGSDSSIPSAEVLTEEMTASADAIPETAGYLAGLSSSSTGGAGPSGSGTGGAGPTGSGGAGPTGSGGAGPSGSGSGGAGPSGSGSGGAGPSGSGTGGAGPETAVLPELPFQLQIVYTDVDGMKALRVLTQKKPVTSDRNVAEKDADLKVLGVHTERKASQLALQGDYTGSRAVALMNQRLGWRSSRDDHSGGDQSRRKMYHKAFSRVKTVENTITRKQMQEIVTHGRSHSDDEDACEDFADDDMEVASRGLSDIVPLAVEQSSHRVVSDGPGGSGPAPKGARRKLSKQKMRSEEVDDSMAQMMYQSRSSSTAHFTHKE